MRILKWIVIVLVVAFVLAQFIRPDMTNPPVDQKLTIQSNAQVPANIDQMLRRSCYDCHSYETRFPWYSHVAPMSWLLADDIKDGRNELNFSDWGGYNKARQARKLQELCEQVKEGEMPVEIYLPLHPDAKLTDGDRQTLCSWSNDLRTRIVASMTPAERAQMERRRPEREPETERDKD